MTRHLSATHHAPKTSSQQPNTLLFEHPCQTIVKTLLKLEHALQAFAQHTQTHDVSSTMAHLMCLIRMVSRADVKAQITKHMHQQHRHLLNFKGRPQVHGPTLDQTLHHLEAHLSHLTHATSLLDAQLIDHPLLKTLQTDWLQDGVLARHCNHAFHAWCALPYAACQPTLEAWQAALQPITAMVSILLKLIRQSATFQDVTCHNTTFTKHLSANLNLAMVRIRLPNTVGIIPEISAGRHQMTIQFKKSVIEAHDMTQTHCMVTTFAYACCHQP